MAVVEMMGVSLIGPKQEIEGLAAELLTLGNFQPVPLEYALEKRPAALERGGAHITTFQKNPYDDLLKDLLALWDRAGERLPEGEPFEGLPPSLSYEQAADQVRDISKRLALWQRRADELQEEQEKLLAADVFLDAMAEAGRDVEATLKTKHLALTFGRLTTENARRLQEMATVTPLIVFPVVQSEGHTLVVVFCSREYRPEADNVFRSLFLKEYPLSQLFEGAGADMKGRLKDRVGEYDRAILGLKAAPKNYLGRRRRELEELYSAVMALQRVYALCQRRGELSGVVVLSGLIPAPTLPEVASAVERLGANTLLLTEKEEELERRGRQLPTLLKNNPFVKTFQELVALYSLPSYDEADPSPLVALSFCLFFGFMFGDVGHGALLVLGAWYLARRNVLNKAFASIIRIAGLSAMGFGLLYGSVFGSEEILPALWTSPMHGIPHLIRTSLVVGVAFLSLGLLINILGLSRKKRFGRMLFDGEGVAGLLFYWIAVLAALSAFSGGGVPLAAKILLVALFLVILFSAPLERLIFGPQEGESSAVVHTFSVFHAMLSFLSNTASFVRLAAFALNHAGLSAAVFMLGDMVHTLPGGVLFKTAVLIVGNAVIVGLEGLIVFIQTLRLEYYEFFSKFYRGGGTPFSPITWDSQIRE